MEKLYVSGNQLLDDSYRLAHQVYESGFEPDFIVGVWRGGTPIGIAIHEYLDYRGIVSDHCSMRAISYYGISKRKDLVQVHGLEYLLERLKPEHKVLIVDDVFETGHTLVAIMNELYKKLGGAIPQNIKLATVYFKPERNQTDVTPHYHVMVTEDWIVFPHELDGLTEEEILENKPAVLRDLLSKG